MTNNSWSLQLKARFLCTNNGHGFYFYEYETLNVMCYDVPMHYWKLYYCQLMDLLDYSLHGFICLICVFYFTSKEMKYPHRQYR